MSEAPSGSYMDWGNDRSSRKKKREQVPKERSDRNRDDGAQREEKISPLKKVASRLFSKGSSSSSKEVEQRPTSSRGRKGDRPDDQRPSSSRSSKNSKRTPSEASQRTLYAAPRPGEGDCPPLPHPLPAGFYPTSDLSATSSHTTLSMRPPKLSRAASRDTAVSQSPSRGSPHVPSSFRTYASSTSLNSSVGGHSPGPTFSGNSRTLRRRETEAENNIVAYRLTLARLATVEHLLRVMSSDQNLVGVVGARTLLTREQVATMEQTVTTLRTVAGELNNHETPEMYDNINKGADNAGAIINMARRDADAAARGVDKTLYRSCNSWEPRMGGAEL